MIPPKRNVVRRRKNTLEEKRKMRNNRIRRKRYIRSLASEKLKAELAESKQEQKRSETQSIIHRKMAKTYWDRWHNELEERKALMMREVDYLFRLRYSLGIPQQTAASQLPIIDRTLLTNPSSLGDSPSDEYLFVGRGSFGIVKYQEFRGISVAVKEFLPRTLAAREGQILSKLCHPYLPLFFGIATDKYPHIIVMQYHGVNGKCITLHRELSSSVTQIVPDSRSWLILCAQIFEAVWYLHDDAKILHNDLKCDNILLTPSMPHGATSSRKQHTSKYQVIFIDFGKATEKDSGKKYDLSFSEKLHYQIHYRHIAPEVIDGRMKQSIFSDIYSTGRLMRIILSRGRLEGLDKDSTSKLETIINKCTSEEHSRRPSAVVVCDSLKKLSV